MLFVAVRAARRAGDMILRHYEQADSYTIQQKQDRDFVTEVDKAAEGIIIREIRKHYPNHGIVAEESSPINSDADIQWYIDPLDGTTNFVHGYPHFCVSIAAWQKGKPLLAVVHDPIRDETFEAKNGGGAFLNRRRMRVSTCKLVKQAIFASGLPPYQRQGLDDFQKRMDNCMRAADGYRRGGSAALDLAYVAAGRIDAYWEAGLKSWDIAAGVLLIQEAGGIATGLSGESIDLNKGDVLVGNADMHAAFQKLIQL